MNAKSDLNNSKIHDESYSFVLDSSHTQESIDENVTTKEILKRQKKPKRIRNTNKSIDVSCSVEHENSDIQEPNDENAKKKQILNKVLRENYDNCLEDVAFNETLKLIQTKPNQCSFKGCNGSGNLIGSRHKHTSIKNCPLFKKHVLEKTGQNLENSNETDDEDDSLNINNRVEMIINDRITKKDQRLKNSFSIKKGSSTKVENDSLLDNDLSDRSPNLTSSPLLNKDVTNLKCSPKSNGSSPIVKNKIFNHDSGVENTPEIVFETNSKIKHEILNETQSNKIESHTNLDLIKKEPKESKEILAGNNYHFVGFYKSRGSANGRKVYLSTRGRYFYFNPSGNRQTVDSNSIIFDTNNAQNDIQDKQNSTEDKDKLVGIYESNGSANGRDVFINSKNKYYYISSSGKKAFILDTNKIYFDVDDS